MLGTNCIRPVSAAPPNVVDCQASEKGFGKGQLEILIKGLPTLFGSGFGHCSNRAPDFLFATETFV